jgi:N-acetylglucosaminyldiphosphoundecaprenol N-acetyl-beta-D-mannosaminyltransferase
VNEGLVTRVRILNVPVDIVKEEHLNDLICQLAENGKTNQIILLDFPGFMKARRKKGEWKEAVNSAALILPVSYRILNAARFLKIEKPVHYKSFDFIITLLGILENRRKSAYLLGSSKKKIQKSFNNLKKSFPGLLLVGRFQGNWDKNRENDIIMAIKKASPSLLLAGKKIKGRDLWLYRNRHKLNPGITLWNRNCYEIMGGRKSKPPETKVSRLFRNTVKAVFLPWRWARLLRQIWFWLLLLWARVFGNRDQ